MLTLPSINTFKRFLSRLWLVGLLLNGVTGLPLPAWADISQQAQVLAPVILVLPINEKHQVRLTYIGDFKQIFSDSFAQVVEAEHIVALPAGFRAGYGARYGYINPTNQNEWIAHQTLSHWTTLNAKSLNACLAEQASQSHSGVLDDEPAHQLHPDLVQEPTQQCQRWQLVNQLRAEEIVRQETDGMAVRLWLLNGVVWQPDPKSPWKFSTNVEGLWQPVGQSWRPSSRSEYRWLTLVSRHVAPGVDVGTGYMARYFDVSNAGSRRDTLFHAWVVLLVLTP
jgi:hypothetical protein